MAQNTDTAILVRMEATLTKFEKQMARAKKVGRDTALATERQFANSNKKMSRSAEASAQAIGREMDRLRAKYDPVFAASKRYEASLDELNRAHKLGAINTQQYEAALERLNAEYARSNGAAAGMVASGKRVTTSMRGMGGGIQNVAFQVGDFATQVGAGTSASIALGQQLPQLLGGFGALGAVLGAVVAIGVPLAAAFMRSGDEAETLEKRLENLQKAVDEYRDAVDRTFIPTEELAKKYGTATAAAREFIAALRDVSEANARDEANSALTAVARQFGTFEDAAQGPRQMMQGWSEVTRTIENMSEALAITEAQARKLVPAFEALDSAEGAKERTEAARELVKALEDALGPAEDMTDAQREVYLQIVEAGDEMAKFVGASERAADGLSGMASEAARIADELERAVTNAINLAAQGISDVRRAKIEWEFRDDPIGREGALARERFDTQTPVPANADSTIKNAIEAERREFVQAAISAEEYRQKIIAWRKEQAEANKKGRKSGGRGRKKPGLFERSDDQLLALERELDMLGKTGREVAELRAKYRLLDEARERGLDLDARSAASGQTLREEIDRQAEAIGGLTEKYDQARDRAKFYDAQQQAVKDGMIDAIVEGENLAGVLEGVAKSFAKAALQAALFGDGPLSGMFGGAEGGGLFGALGIKLPFAAAGTAFSHGGPTVVGERGPEIVNLPRGSKVFSAEKSRGMMGGGMSVTVNNYSSDSETRERRRYGPNGEEVIIDVVNKGAAAGKLTGVQSRYGLSNQRVRR